MEVEFETRPNRAGSLIWSEDNVLALVTNNVLHIFAPSLSGALGQSSSKFYITSAPALTAQEDSPPWAVPGNVATLRHAMSPQSIDFILAAWSPTGCSPVKGCMLACITSRHSVFLYIPTSSHLDKQWKKYVALDKHLAAHWNAGPTIDLEMADRIESASLAWSPKIAVDNIGSVLALGNKAGHIMIWHTTDPHNIRCVKAWKTSSDTWIVCMAWSPWTIEDDHYISTLAFATADGVVQARKIKFSPITPLKDIDVSEDLIDNSRHTLHPCTVLRWSPTNIEDAAAPNALAYSKGNRLNIWFPESNKVLLWRRPIAKAIADIEWDTHGTKLFVFFMDGKHAVLRLQGDEITVDEEGIEFIHQTIISHCHVQSKTNISQEEGETENANADEEGGDEEASGAIANSKLQLHINSGARSVGGLQLAIVYYVASSFRMEFQRERFQSCTFVLSKAHNDAQSVAQALLKRLEIFIHLPNAVLLRNPTYHLWDLLSLLNETAKTSRGISGLAQKVLSILDANASEMSSEIQALARKECMPDTGTSPESRLEAAIFKEPSITADRLCVYLWAQLQQCGVNIFDGELGHRATAADIRLRKHCIRSILQLFNEASAAISRRQSSSDIEARMKECDQILLLLLCDSILLFHREDEALLDLAEKTYWILQDQLQGLCDIKEQMDMLQDIKKNTTSIHRSFSSGRETCPACGGEIKLESELHATCTNGHAWQRCSITLLVLADFHPRTCIGCRRKTLMVPDAKSGVSFLSGSHSDSWLELVLKANGVCCFCGERYFTALRRRS